MAATLPGGWPPGWPPLKSRVYHRMRKQSGIVLDRGAPDTTWVQFDGEADPAEVSSCLLERETADPGSGPR